MAEEITPTPEEKPQGLYAKGPDDEIGKLLDERQQTHGDAHLIIGQYLSTMYAQGLLDKIFATPYCYDWIMIFAKLVRITQQPFFPDNWSDVQGYGRLVSENLAE